MDLAKLIIRTLMGLSLFDALPANRADAAKSPQPDFKKIQLCHQGNPE